MTLMMNISHKGHRLIKYMLVLLILSLSAAGCALKPKPPFEVESPEKSMIFGNVKIPGHEVTEIELREYGRFYMPPFAVPPRVMIFRNGDFVAENLKPGNYYISRFVANKLNYTLVNGERSAYQWIINVEPGALKYVGAYEITDVVPGVFVKGDFNIRTLRHPTERAILKRMYEITQGTGWQDRVDRRLKSLR